MQRQSLASNIVLDPINLHYMDKNLFYIPLNKINHTGLEQQEAE